MLNEQIATAIKKRDKHDIANEMSLADISAAMGNRFGTCISEIFPNYYRRNPHEKGHPDLLPINEKSKPWLELPTIIPYHGEGAFDMKGKLIHYGEAIDVGASSHHNETTSLMSVAYTPIGNIPKIICCAYVNDLVKEDWSIISKKLNSRATPNTSLIISGMEKLRSNWLFYDKDYQEQFGLKSRFKNKKDWFATKN